MKFPLTPSVAAKLLLQLAARNRWRHIQKIADRDMPKYFKAISKAMKAGLGTINRKMLREALASQDEVHVLTLLSHAVLTTELTMKPLLEELLAATLEESGHAAVARLPRVKSAAVRPTGMAFDITNPAAVEWIREHAAELVMNVSHSTRNRIRDLVDDAFEEQFDVDELADEIDAILHDPARAETIARTETMRASNQGQLEAWDQATEAGLLTGAEKKEWIVTPDDKLCPICEPLDGKKVALDDDFESDGDKFDGPPAHPNCRCAVGLSLG